MSSVPMLGLLGLRQQGSQSNASNASNAAAVAAASTASAASAGKSPSAKVSWLPSLARQPTSDGTLEVKTGDGNDGVGKGAAPSAQVPTTVPTPRVAEPLPVLLGRTRFNPQRTRNAESEACAHAAREAFLERQARRASRVTG